MYVLCDDDEDDNQKKGGREYSTLWVLKIVRRGLGNFTIESSDLRDFFNEMLTIQ